MDTGLGLCIAPPELARPCPHCGQKHGAQNLETVGSCNLHASACCPGLSPKPCFNPCFVLAMSIRQDVRFSGTGLMMMLPLADQACMCARAHMHHRGADISKVC